MANYSSLSQASNISGISNVSAPTVYPGKRNCSQFEELNKSFFNCEEIISDYAIKKLIKECVREASLNDDEALTQSTAKKLRQLLATFEVEKYLYLPNNNQNDINEKLTLLGITDLPKIKLNYEEKLDIKRLVEKKLRKKTDEFLARFEEMGGNIDELMKRGEFIGRQRISEVFETDMFQWKEQIEEECVEYEKVILEYKKYFSEWISLKYGDMNDTQLKKAESLLVKVQISEAQAKITKLNCILKMFKDTPFTLEAYQTISSRLDSRIAEMEEEIKKKEAMKKSYEDLKGSKYDQVAQRYSEICKAIENKKRLLEHLH